MKLLVCFFVCLSASEVTFALTRNSPELGTCKRLASEAASNPLLEGFNTMPLSWEDFYSVRYAKEGRLEASAVGMNRTNELAMVPGAPQIKVGAGISREIIGCRLLVISREEKFHKEYGGLGRYAIVVGQLPGEPSKLRFLSYFIPSESARAILLQIPDFDPSTQPLAFEPEFIAKVERELKERDKKFLQAANNHYRKLAAVEKIDHPVRSLFYREGSVLLWVWLAAGMLILVVIWLYGYPAIRRRGER